MLKLKAVIKKNQQNTHIFSHKASKQKIKQQQMKKTCPHTFLVVCLFVNVYLDSTSRSVLAACGRFVVVGYRTCNITIYIECGWLREGSIYKMCNCDGMNYCIVIMTKYANVKCL